jgi:hypothetical protein
MVDGRPNGAAAARPPIGGVGRWRLSTRITAVVLATLIPLLVTVGISYAELARQRRAAEVENAALIGQTVAAVVDGFARDIEGTTLAFALALGPSNAPLDQPTLGPLLNTLAREYPVLRAIFVTDPSGRVVAAQRGEGIGADLSARPYLQALRAGEETVWIPAIVGAQSRERTVAFGRVVRGPDGAPRAYLVAAYYLPQLLERLAVRLPADSDVAFYDSRGALLHSTSRPDLPDEGRDASSSPLMAAALRGAVVRLDGDTAIYAVEARFGVLAPVPRIGWVVAFTRPLGPLEVQLREQLAQQVAGTALTILAAALLLSWLTRRLLRPVAVLARAAGAIARGERPAMPTVSGDAEVVALAAGMAAMSAAVAEREDAIRRQSDRLGILAEASRTLAEAGLSRQGLLDAVVAVVARGVGDGCCVSLVSPDRSHLHAAAAFHSDPEALELVRRLLAAPQPADQGLAARVIDRGEPVLIPEVTEETLATIVADESREYSRRFGFHSLAVVPLAIRGRPIGALAIWRDAPGHPSMARTTSACCRSWPSGPGSRSTTPTCSVGRSARPRGPAACRRSPASSVAASRPRTCSGRSPARRPSCSTRRSGRSS